MNSPESEDALHGSHQVIADDAPGTRLDVFLASKLPGLSRSRISKLIREGRVLVNGKQAKPSYPVELGDELVVNLPPPETVAPEPIEFGVIHEDEALAIIDKPTGLVVHCTPVMLSGTLVNGLLHRFDNLSTVGGAMRRGIVHRLDKDTSGVMVVAKTDEAHHKLAAQFESRQVKKEYVSIVHGSMAEESYEIDLPVSRNPHNRKLMTARTGRGRPSHTLIEPLERFEVAALVTVTPGTGRTHQIRVHLAAIGHPVIADRQYGGRSMQKRPTFGMTRQALHASRIAFTHPQTGEWVQFEAPLPEDMRAALERLRGE